MFSRRIVRVIGREILDSRGNPTIEANVFVDDGSVGYGAAPSGASTGRYEALELRDNVAERYMGKGVSKAVANINTVINNTLQGMPISDLYKIDWTLMQTDGTPDKSRLGANAILAVSIAAANAAAASYHMPLYRFLGGVSGNRMPVPMMNILNGGAHAGNSIDIQEFMIMPVGAPNFREALRWCAEVYHMLQKILKERNLTTAVGDEGGFAPDLRDAEDALDCIVSAIQKAGYTMEKDFLLALDAAASEWKSRQPGEYLLPKAKTTFSTEELIQYWKNLSEKYPIISIEDPLDEEDWKGWQELTKWIGNKVQLVGDDLFVTNRRRLMEGIQQKCANSILIKPNQIGTITETFEAIKTAKFAGYTTIASHRSGETEDTTIADLAVGLNMGQIKTGAPTRTERVAKYNRLLRIEEELNGLSIYPGKGAFH